MTVRLKKFNAVTLPYNLCDGHLGSHPENGQGPIFVVRMRLLLLHTAPGRPIHQPINHVTERDEKLVAHWLDFNRT